MFVTAGSGGLFEPLGLVFQSVDRESFFLTLETTGQGSGTVVSSPEGIDCLPDCSHAFFPETTVTLTASPQPDSVFIGWQGGGCSGIGPCILTLDQPRTVIAQFEPIPPANTFRLTIVRAGQATGAVTSSPPGIDCGVTCSETFTADMSVTLTAVAPPGVTFVGWGGAGCSGVAPCVVTLTQDQIVTAVFEPTPVVENEIPLSVVKVGTGSGRVRSDPFGIDCGSTCTQSFAINTEVQLSAPRRSGRRSIAAVTAPRSQRVTAGKDGGGGRSGGRWGAVRTARHEARSPWNRHVIPM